MPKKTWNCFIDFKFYLFKFSHTKSVPTLTDAEAKWYDMQSSNTGALYIEVKATSVKLLCQKSARKLTAGAEVGIAYHGC